ncbi:hypothetical protein [Caloramator proteoclasticus]|uniref:ABC-2 type transport system permease protein n=1 Tax=Caloramator proteoclasticus DSM 10124 TaxID=1121262 RepID=A0A1M4XIA7_9CLOT|nr:hypothetical protein [Caloramator proteoclasticus]SHE93106.1 hypothetical protein SAMN02746091_01417 [Caloramator proteoclasticus DSM 10124]
MEFLLLKLLGKFKFIFNYLKVDFETLYRILEIKFKNDRRARTSLYKDYKVEGESKKSQIISFILGVILFGLAPSIAFTLHSIELVSNLSIAVIMILIFLSLVHDFSTVILSTSDKNILGAMPIDMNTLSSVRGTYVTIYLISILVMTIILPTSIGTYIFDYKYIIGMLIVTPLILMFSLSLTILIYSLILKHYDGEKLKDIVNYFQITFLLGSILFYQFGADIIQRSSNVLQNSKAIFILPSTWYSGIFNLLLGEFNIKRLIAFILGSLATILFFIITQKYLLVELEKNLYKFDMGNKSQSVIKKGKLVDLIIKDPVEKSSYIFSKAMFKRDRMLKQKMITGLSTAFIFVAPLIRDVLSGKEQDIVSWFFAVYGIIVFLSTQPQFIAYTSNFKAAYIYEVLPIEDVEPIVKGAIKAVFINFIMPIFILALLIFSIIFKHIGILEYIVAIIMMIFMCLIYVNDMEIKMPFTVDVKTVESSGNGCLSAIKYVMIAIVFGVAHGFIYSQCRDVSNIDLVKIYTYIYFVFIFALIGTTVFYYFKAFKFKRRKIYKGKVSTEHKV